MLIYLEELKLVVMQRHTEKIILPLQIISDADGLPVKAGISGKTFSLKTIEKPSENIRF